MGKNTAIEWAHHTFNPWIGCTKISPECADCYAEGETFVRVQRSRGRELWGVNADRHVTSSSNWRDPLSWNHSAAAAGERHRVFCASLADVGEDRPDLVAPRARLCDLILQTPALDWLLLTKRIENMLRLFPLEVLRKAWVGTTAGTRKRMLEAVPHLANIPSPVRFISIEPLLEDVTGGLQVALSVLGSRYPRCEIDWLIAGGKSGGRTEPMHPAWARGVRDMAIGAGVPFLFKQWGDWIPINQVADTDALYRHYPPSRKYPDGRQECKSEHLVLQLDGTIRNDFPHGAMTMFKVGKKAAGRLLDGIEWNGLPEVAACV